MKLDKNYWSNRYMSNETQWDAGTITTPLKDYFDQLINKESRILIPGCGNAYEAEYLFYQGFKNVYLVDLSSTPLSNFSQRCPGFPKSHLIHQDFFALDDQFDLIIEQTFFCSLLPKQRPDYARQVFNLLKENGKLVGVLFNDPLFDDRPPFGGNKEEYEVYFKPYFDFNVFEVCYNSIKPRRERELFMNLSKKS
ncbi:methyltransferase domain-containing protein [Fulvivirgaceae bacterium BMA10]|uniref:Methyltransferase domain-containing protein n=1 Tax=Splendidivirga corallicola TaxID=3051826 RepID=A0ABT8KIU6_9BACT|nr:methyltransferase domain-containing protein [Fulvivirgaceae bacterium BMA10]